MIYHFCYYYSKISTKQRHYYINAEDMQEFAVVLPCVIGVGAGAECCECALEDRAETLPNSVQRCKNKTLWNKYKKHRFELDEILIAKYIFNFLIWNLDERIYEA